jgi:hypothetical protein
MGTPGVACVAGLPADKYTWTQVTSPRGYTMARARAIAAGLSAVGPSPLVLWMDILDCGNGSITGQRMPRPS